MAQIAGLYENMQLGQPRGDFAIGKQLAENNIPAENFPELPRRLQTLHRTGIAVTLPAQATFMKNLRDCLCRDSSSSYAAQADLAALQQSSPFDETAGTKGQQWL